jgi:uncharacterized protein (DUF2141 family)
MIVIHNEKDNGRLDEDPFGVPTEGTDSAMMLKASLARPLMPLRSRSVTLTCASST